MSETEPIRVTYTFEFADLAAISASAAKDPKVKRHNLKVSLPFLIGTLAVGGAFLIFFVLVVTNLISMNRTWLAIGDGLFGASMFVGLLTLLSFFFKKTRMKSAFSLQPIANQAITNCLSNDGVSSDLAKMRGTYDWLSIARLDTTPDHLLLFISPLQALVFPRRAFASTEAFAAAIEFAKARTQPPPA